MTYSLDTGIPVGDNPPVDIGRLAQRMIEGRAQRRWSQLRLARESALDKGTINEIETGQRQHTHKTTVKKIADALALDVAEFETVGPQVSQGDRSIAPTPPTSEETNIVTDPQLRNLLDRWSTDAALRTIFTLWRDLTPSQRHELASHALTMTAPPVQPPQRKK